MSEISQIKISKTEQKEIDIELERANDLMEEGAKEELKGVIEKLLLKYPKSEEIYDNAILFYNWLEMYSEIKKLFFRYKENTGNDLKTDVSLEEYEKRYKEYLTKNPSIAEKGGKRKFKRLRWSLYLIEWVEVDDIGIKFKKIGSESRFYKWSEMQVILRKIKVGHRSPFGRGLIIQASDRKKYKMQISPGDKQSEDFLMEIRKHLEIKRGPDKTETILLGIPAVLIFAITGLMAAVAGSNPIALVYILVFIFTYILYDLISSRF
ncbi:hypothetical protein KKB43_02160 [Patescibacteria group bacterium]|nr:hypothetical protein [Patescibacteria group bacterium]